MAPGHKWSTTGSVLGPIILIKYIDSLEIELKSTIPIFADDIKVGGRALTKADWEISQRDLDPRANGLKNYSCLSVLTSANSCTVN